MENEKAIAKEEGFVPRVRETLFVWRKVFTQNWNLFKASRIGVIGLAIMIAFVLLALSAPFMGLRDPIRWIAPDEDLIDVRLQWAKQSTDAGSELVGSPPFSQAVAFRVLPETFEGEADRVYAAAGNRLYALNVRRVPGQRVEGGQNAWGSLRYFNVAADGGVRTITGGPLVMNYGDFERSTRGDYEIYLGTSDGALFILRDPEGGLEVPKGFARFELGSSVSGLAAFGGDEKAPEAILGFANYARRDGATWTTERVTTAAERVDEGESVSLALDPAGRVHMAFYDLRNQRPINATRVASSWLFNSSEPSSALDVGAFTSLAIGTDGFQRLSYVDNTTGAEALKFARWDGTAWNVTFVDASDRMLYSSLALDASNRAHIAYYANATRTLKYARWNGTAWAIRPVDATGGEHASIALNGTGSPAIAYFARAGGLRYALWNGSDFASEVVDASVASVRGDGLGRHATLAFDRFGNASLAYYDAQNGDLKFARREAGGWTISVVDAPGDVGRFPSLAVDSANVPAIAYHDATNLDLKFAWLDSGSWRNLTIVSEGHVGLYPSLAFDATDRPHVGYHSFATGRTTKDIIVAGTETGAVTAIDVGIPGPIRHTVNRIVPANPIGERQVLSWDYRVRWTATVDGEVRLASGPLRSISKVPLFSPAFDEQGGAVYLGTSNGTLWALRTADGLPFWTEDDNVTARTFRVGAPWSSPPIASKAVGGPHAQQEILYAGSNYHDHDGDGERETLLFALFAADGRPLPQWASLFANHSGGARVFRDALRELPDEGDLGQPSVSGGVIYVGSSSGRFYAYRRDAQGGVGESALLAASQQWLFSDVAFSNQGYRSRFVGAPVVIDEQEIILVNANHDAGTPDPADDVGVAYSLNTLAGNISWRRSLAAPVAGGPASWKPEGGLERSAWIAFGDSEVTGVIAFASTGQYLAPSPPSWAKEHDCPPEKGPPGSKCSGYPSGNQYWLGLDSQGRDIFSQVVWGSRIALLVGFLAAFFSVLLGVVVGLVAGYSGGKMESVLMRFTDVILVLPGLPLIITLAAVLGTSIWNIILVISLLGWPGIARIIRAEVLSLKERPFIDSARVTGASTTRIVFRHIAPNVLPLAFLYMTFAVSGAILAEASLSFIGLGDISTMSWGIMLQLVSQSKALEAWYWLLPPGMAITLISLAFFLVGRAFDEIVNPRLRKR